MRTHRDQVIVLKSRNYSEADKILNVFGKEFGKFSLLAKGMRRMASKNRGNMQTLSIADVSFYKAQGIPLLLESKSVVIPDFTTLDINNSSRVLTLIHKLIPEDQKYPRVYTALKKAIKDGLSDELTSRFRLLFLIEEGLIDNMQVCNTCGNSEGNKYLQLSSFVLVCENCYSNKKWSSSDIVNVQEGLYMNPKFIKALDHYINNLLLNLV